MVYTHSHDNGMGMAPIPEDVGLQHVDPVKSVIGSKRVGRVINILKVWKWNAPFSGAEDSCDGKNEACVANCKVALK